MPATISHSLSMTTPNDPAFEKVLKRREASANLRKGNSCPEASTIN